MLRLDNAMFSNVTEVLDRSAEKFPNNIALSDENGTLTYNELLQISRKIATYIAKIGIKKQPVVVCMEKSINEAATFWGVAYSSCFYTPIDSSMPPSRISKIIETLEPALAITTQETKELLEQSSYNGPVVNLSECLKTEIDINLVNKSRNELIDTDPLYVLFTSGSTGLPKGVTICHRSVIDYIYNIKDVFKLDEQTVFGNQAPFYFDNSVLDIYTSILVGGRMHIIPPKLFAYPVPLLKHLVENNINLIFWVPSVLIAVANLKALTKVDLSGITRVLFAGEAMPAKQLNMWRHTIPNAIFANLYGPTEITVDCTYYIVNREIDDNGCVPIGNAFNNSEVLILDENNDLISSDNTETVGELCVRGSSLALGYYGNPQKTAEVFVQNPLNDKFIDKIYRTGDMAKYNEHGEIEFLSRKDQQIKISGNRVELGEIEAAACSIDGVMECCCCFDTHRKKLVLVYCGSAQSDDVKKGIAAYVPPYMIPSKYMQIKSMPYNANGKIDRLEVAKICL